MLPYSTPISIPLPRVPITSGISDFSYFSIHHKPQARASHDPPSAVSCLTSNGTCISDLYHSFKCQAKHQEVIPQQLGHLSKLKLPLYPSSFLGASLPLGSQGDWCICSGSALSQCFSFFLPYFIYLSLCGTEAPTQCLTCAGQVLFHWATTPAPSQCFSKFFKCDTGVNFYNNAMRSVSVFSLFLK